jgi:hypothetical protein
MLSDPFTTTLDTYGTAQDDAAHTREWAAALFDALHQQARRAQQWGWLFGQPAALETLDYAPAATARPSGIVTVPLAEIIGTEDRADDFDAEFRPLRAHTRDRWIGVAAAWAGGAALPPVELVATDAGYYVRDGHHRISVAKANGQLEIEALFVNA